MKYQMPNSSTRLAAPCESHHYLQMRAMARKQGVEEDFRWLCALLEAPSDLRCLLLVAGNLKNAIALVPKNWALTENFDPLRSAANWVVANSSKLPAVIAEEKPPLVGVYPLYAMMCHKYQIHPYLGIYHLLQLQVLSSRERELKKVFGSSHRSYIDKYESFELNTENNRIEAELRFPHHVGWAVRKLGTGSGVSLVDFLEPQQIPTAFAAGVRKKIVAQGGIPVGEHFSAWANTIMNYCAVKSSSREFAPRNAREKHSASSGVSFGYIEYSPTLSGMYLGSFDPDDRNLNEPQQEVQLVRSGHADQSEDDDEHRDESAIPGTVAIHPSAHRTGVRPGEIARIRASVARLEIDREILPWSASQLRVAEISSTLLSALKNITWSSIAEHETATLVAVCLETGRPLEQVLNLPYGQDANGSFSLLYRAGTDRPVQWCWRAIKPEYKQEWPFVNNKEASLTDFIVNPITDATETLLTRVIELRENDDKFLFTDSEDKYRGRIHSWLKSLDPTGRITIAKLFKLQWSILLQLTGNDYTEASMVLGYPHPRARVPLYYSLMTVVDAQRLFTAATRVLWGEEICA
jgi:hypothetical protein